MNKAIIAVLIILIVAVVYAMREIKKKELAGANPTRMPKQGSWGNDASSRDSKGFFKMPKVNNSLQFTDPKAYKAQQAKMQAILTRN
jgi:hypothetical protein